MFLAEIFIYAAVLYLILGVLFAVWFVAFRIAKFDDSAKGTSVFFRIIIFFGAMALWVLLLKQILQNQERIEVTAHRL
jgi:hypothetical protein